MANLTPTPSWSDVTAWDDNTVAKGSEMNAPAQALLNRTELLRNYTPLPFVPGREYKLNERVQLDNGNIVLNTIANNTNDPNNNTNGWDVISKNIQIIESIDELLTISNPRNGQVKYVKSYHAGLGKGGGFFEYIASRQSENDGGNVFNGWVRQVHPRYLNAYNFGATGAGSQDYYDQDATKKISNLVKSSNEKGFIIHYTDGDYTLGRQSFTAGTGFTVENGLDISFNEMTEKYIFLKLDNARFKMRDNLHYGVFDKNTGAAFTTTMPFYPSTPSWAADGNKVTLAGLGYMFNFSNIKGLVTEGLAVIDGNMENTIIGGQYGDTGWQLISYGFRVAVVERFDISNITSKNHCLDGVYIAGVNSYSTPNIPNTNYRGTLRNIVSTGNGRQGCSFTGGQNISWYDCNFDKTGLNSFKVQSAPKSCFDIEAEISPIRNARFYNCFFGHGMNSSLVADSGNTADVHFYSCKFINPTGSVAWVRKPKFKFFSCYFNGQVLGQYGTSVEEDRTLYQDCTFTDDPDVNPDFIGIEYLINAASANPKLINCTINTFKSGWVFDYDYAGTARPFTMIGGSINFKTTGGAAMAGDYIDVTFQDLRADPSPAWYPTIGGVTVNCKVTSPTGVSGTAIYGSASLAVNPRDVYRRLSSPYADNRVSYFELKANADGGPSQAVSNLIKVQHSNTLFLIDGIKYNLGDRIYCTDPTQNIDYWVCTTSGFGTSSVWKKVLVTLVT